MSSSKNLNLVRQGSNLNEWKSFIKDTKSELDTKRFKQEKAYTTMIPTERSIQANNDYLEIPNSDRDRLLVK